MPPNDSQQASKPYHHGNLRNALIIAAAELIEETGADHFAMVDAARRAGVSTAAPYRHFRDREDLLFSVAQLGFYALDAELERIRDQRERGSIDTLIAMGQSYIRCVTSMPAFFTLMWGEQGMVLEAGNEQEQLEERARGFWMLVDQVAAWCERERVNEPAALEISMNLWSICMGLCHLHFNRQIERFAPGLNAYDMLSSSARAYLGGLAAGKH
ncbi:MAG: TetR/AcrR family transcriptional regulator [Halioglobus sp.]